MRKVEGYRGILFIGDLHLASRRPGRRLDDYTAAGLDKLKQAVAIAKERKLYPVCLGDFFHRAGENDIELIAQVSASLRHLDDPLYLLGGSHDRVESWFTDKDAAKLLAGMGVLRLVDEPGPIVAVDCDGKRVVIWGAPAGARLPKSLMREPGVTNILITHHDLDFNGKFPGATELFEIENCDLLVNGHMHTPTPMRLVGRMAAHNPGSVMRVSVDLKNHKPAVSMWTPAHGLNLAALPLKVAPDVFDLTGKEVYAADPKTLKGALPKGLRLSAFAAKLRGTETLESARTDDGAVLIEELEAYFKLFDKPDNVRRYMTGLVRDAVTERIGS